MRLADRTAGRAALVSAILLILAGCGAVERGLSAGLDIGGARSMFITGFEDIDSVYIEPVDLGVLAIAGLDNLSTIDPNLQIERNDADVSLLVQGRPATSFAAPGPHDAVDWGILTATAMRVAQSTSVALRDTPDETLYDTVFSGVVDRLDDYSRYAGADTAQENRASREGFGGVGIRISVEDGEVRIVSVMHYTPAERAGLRPDDVITHIDGDPTFDMDQEMVIRRLRGPVDSRVVLTIERDGPPAPLTVAVHRAHVVPETVTYQREDNVAYLRIYSFNLETADGLRKEIRNAQRDIGPGLRGYVLDLRNNPGGLLDEAVEVADLFIDRGRIVSTHGRHPDSHQYFEAADGDIVKGTPIVVLINGNSASAAEIVAAALQDSGRAVVIGSNSYGKGTVQTVLPMPNNGELTLTWARFHAPSGYTLNHLGVLPTICTNQAGRNASHLITELRDGTLTPVPTVIRNATSPSDEPALNRLREVCPVRKGEEPVDLQLALQLLAEPTLYSRAIHLADPGLTAADPTTVTQAQQ